MKNFYKSLSGYALCHNNSLTTDVVQNGCQNKRTRYFIFRYLVLGEQNTYKNTNIEQNL